MEANLVSAQVSVFYSKIAKTFPKSSQRFYLAQILIKSIKLHIERGWMNYLLNNSKEKYWVISQQALFIKAFQLGVRFQRCSHERQELKHKESIIKHVTNTSKYNILPMHRHLIGQQIIKASKNQHMKGSGKKQQQSPHNER